MPARPDMNVAAAKAGFTPAGLEISVEFREGDKKWAPVDL